MKCYEVQERFSRWQWVKLFATVPHACCKKQQIKVERGEGDRGEVGEEEGLVSAVRDEVVRLW